MAKFYAALIVAAAASVGVAHPALGQATATTTIRVAGLVNYGSVVSPWPITEVPAPKGGEVVTLDYTIANTTPASGNFGPGNAGVIYSGAIGAVALTINGTSIPLTAASASTVAALSNGNCTTCSPAYFEDDYQAAAYTTYSTGGGALDAFVQVLYQSPTPLGIYVKSTTVGTVPTVPATVPPTFTAQLTLLYNGVQLLTSSPFDSIALYPPKVYVAQSPPASTQCSPAPCQTASTVSINLPLQTTNPGSPQGTNIDQQNITVGTGTAAAQLEGIISGTTLNKSISEQLCTVPIDQRLALFGTCTGHTLKVSDACGGSSPSGQVFAKIDTVIPDFLCGGSGETGKGFAIILGKAGEVDHIPGLLFSNAASAQLAFANPTGTGSGGTEPKCPYATGDWSPLPDKTEGSVPEANPLYGGSGSTLLEMTNGCGTTHTRQRGMSVLGFGLVLNTDALPGSTLVEKFTNFATAPPGTYPNMPTGGKYANLLTTIQTANIQPASVQAGIAACVTASETYAKSGQYACAARRAYKCDQSVADPNNAPAYQSSYSQSNPNGNPNPYGDVRGRLANIYLNFYTRVLGNPSPKNWPLVLGSSPSSNNDPPPPVCAADDWATGTTINSVGMLVPISKPGDLNGDGVVDCADLAIVRAHFGQTSASPSWDPRADINGDGVVNIYDLTLEAKQLPAGQSCQ